MLIMMYAFQKFKQECTQALEGACGCKVEEHALSQPPQQEFGDLSSNVAFELAKKEGKSPVELAVSIAKKISLPKDSLISKVEPKGPYINFFMDYARFASLLLGEATKKGYGKSSEGKGKTVVIDYSSPNIAKPFHIGHLRSTIIGQALYNCYSYLGFDCVGVNYLGDWGTQFGKLIVAYKKWGDKQALEKEPIKELLRVYVLFHKEAEKKLELESEARAAFRKLELGDKDSLEIWKKFVDLSLKDFNKLYTILNIRFDSIRGESFYNDKIQHVLKELSDKKLSTKEADGSVVVKLEPYGLPNYLVQKSDEAALYSTRDIALAEFRAEKYKFWRSIYVVGAEQKLHFQQLFKVLELMGYPHVKDCYHIWFGLVTLPEGKISTRKGRVVFIEDVLNKAVELAQKEVEAKNPELPAAEKKLVAKAVGVGAIKFADLSQNKIKDIVFDLDKMVTFDGDTGPYLQYAHVRTCGILKKLGKLEKPDFSLLAKPEEKQLITKLAAFPDVVRKAALDFETHALADYLLALAHTFSLFYDKCPVAKEDNASLKAARASLVKGTQNVLCTGLALLGIEAPERM